MHPADRAIRVSEFVRAMAPGQLDGPVCGMLACGDFAPTRPNGGTGMRLLPGTKRQRLGATAGPGTMLLGSGWCLYSSCRPEECIEILQQVFDSYRPRRHRDVPPLVPAGIEWTPAKAQPAFALCGYDDSDDFLLFTFTDAGGGTDASIFPLGSWQARLTPSVVGHWQHRDSSLSSIGTWGPGAVRLTPPPIGDVLVDETLQAAGHPLTPGNRAILAEQFTMLFLVKGQEFVGIREGARGAQRFVESYKKRADRTSLTGPLRSALQLLAEWEPGMLPYVQDLPLRTRAILFERMDDDGFLPDLR